jgi:hypothetical protein
MVPKNRTVMKKIFSRQARQDRKDNHYSIERLLEFLGALCVFARENNG